MAPVGAPADSPPRRDGGGLRLYRLLVARSRRPGPSAPRRVRHPPRGVQAGTDQDPRDQPAAAEADRSATVTVDDAIVPFRLDGPSSLGRLRSSTIVVPFHWVEDDPYTVGVTSSSGIETSFDVPAAVEARGASPRGFLGYALIGFLVGVVPVALGLAWLPSLRRADARWLASFMALTAGLLSFLALDALGEALDAPGGPSQRLPGHRADPARCCGQLSRLDLRRAACFGRPARCAARGSGPRGADRRGDRAAQPG